MATAQSLGTTRVSGHGAIAAGRFSGYDVASPRSRTRKSPSEEPSTKDLARILIDVRPQDPASISSLMELVYDPLRALAGQYFRREPGRQTLQPTALVHEAFLRMVGKTDVAWEGRAHFFAVCATAMRGILVDHTRQRLAEKRGGDQQRVTLSDVVTTGTEGEVDLLDLDEALAQLAALNERQARIVEYRFFSGMTNPEIAHALGVSPRTIDKDWAMARAWMSARLSERD